MKKGMCVIIVLGIVSGLVTPTVGARPMMYWSDRIQGSGDTINRAYLDGTGVETILTDLYKPSGISIDHVEGKLYWLEQGRIGRADLDGGNMEIAFGGGVFASRGIAIDITDRMIYFADNGNSRVSRCEMDGSNYQLLIDYPNMDRVGGIDFDSITGEMYWSHSANDHSFQGVHRAAGDGSGPVEDVFNGSDYVSGLVVDHDDQRIFFSDSDNETIKRFDLDSGLMTTLASNLGLPHALDVFDGFVYWINLYDPSLDAVVIQRISVDGVGLETILEVGNPRGFAILVPEPATLTLLALGGLAILRRRRSCGGRA